jgi:Arc/MetJ-type ribon-helix-helix transcriptional regulator
MNGMTMAKIAVSVPKEVLARARLAVKRGKAASLSAYVTLALDEMDRAEEQFDAHLDEALERTGGPVTPEESQRLGAILDGFEQRRAERAKKAQRAR